MTPKSALHGTAQFPAGSCWRLAAPWPAGRNCPDFSRGPGNGLGSGQAERSCSSGPTARPSEKITPENDVTHYNNYYEFGTDKGDPAKNAKNFVTSPWSVSVEGEVAKPRKFTHGRNFEARAARGAHLPASLRGGWSIVVPWIGYSFSTHCQSGCSRTPRPNIVAFQSYYDPKQMPLGRRSRNRTALRRRACASMKR